MSTQSPENPSELTPPNVFHVAVSDDGIIEVDGGTPAEIVLLLQSLGNDVHVNGELMPPPPHVVLEPIEDFGTLSERELSILTLIATGRTNTEIADASYLSINTIKSYIRSAYRKMDVQTRSQAVIWAIDRGVVDAHPKQQS